MKFIDDFGCGNCESISYVWVAKKFGDARTSVGIHVEAVKYDLEGFRVSLSNIFRRISKVESKWVRPIICDKMINIVFSFQATL